jgi:cytidylate kinase
VESSVVCISGSDGAGVNAVAGLVAERLGLPLIDEAIVERAAREAGLEPAEVADVEQRKSFLARILDDLHPGTTAATGYAFAGFVPPTPHEPELGSEELRGLIRTAIEETAARGDAVILAHAASHALANREGVLRVLVTASPETRAARLAEELGLDEEAAAKRVKDGDAGRADYLKRFYGIGRELPTQYDLVVNTDRIDPAQAAGLVVQAAGADA